MMNSRFRFFAVTFLGVTLLGVLVFRLFADTEESAPPVQSNVSVPPAVVELPAQSSPSSTIETEPNAQYSKAAPANPIKSDWFKGYSSSDAYREVVALRESRQPGAFGAGVRLLRPCAGLNAMRSPASDPLLKSTSSTNHQMRLKAKDRLTVYCSQISGEALAAFAEPPEGDKFAAKYVEAINVLDLSMIKSKSENLAAVDELARQGLIFAAKNYILSNLKIGGQAQNYSREESSAAFDIAEMRVSSIAGMEAKDVRLQFRCFTGGPCDDSYDSLSSRFSESESKRILNLASEMERAFRRGDVSALVGPPQ